MSKEKSKQRAASDTASTDSETSGSTESETTAGPAQEESLENRRLDSIARVITGGDICAAVLFDGEKIRVANNTNNDSNLIKKSFSLFRELIDNEFIFTENNEIILDEETSHRIKEIEDHSVAEYEARLDMEGKEENQKKDAVEEFRETINKDLQKIICSLSINEEEHKRFPEDLKEALRRDYIFINSLPDFSYEQKSKSLTLNCITMTNRKESPISISIKKNIGNNLVYYFNGQEIGSESLSSETDDDLAFERSENDTQHILTSKLSNKIKTAIELKGKTEFTNEEKAEILNYVSKEFGIDFPQKHAEMTLIDNLHKDIYKEGYPIKQKTYIGITKLCCLHCNKAMKLFNLLDKNYNVLEIGYRGTHERGYTDWVKPNYCQDIRLFNPNTPKRTAKREKAPDSGSPSRKFSPNKPRLLKTEAFLLADLNFL